MKTTKLPRMRFEFVRQGMFFIYRRKMYIKTAHTTSQYDIEPNATTFYKSNTNRVFFKNTTMVIPVIRSYPEYYGKEVSEYFINQEKEWAKRVLE